VENKLYKVFNDMGLSVGNVRAINREDAVIKYAAFNELNIKLVTQYSFVEKEDIAAQLRECLQAPGTPDNIVKIIALAGKAAVHIDQLERALYSVDH